MAEKVFLIDGHALIFKMFYALMGHPMTNSKGQDTSILYGFTKYLLELISRENPTHLAVALDPPGGTFRNVLYPEYKANRDATPQPIIDALGPIQEICHALNIPTFLVMGYEADDVIGTLAKSIASPSTQVYMVTPDKDYGQLIDDNIFQIRPGKGGGDDELLDKEKICAKYSISSPSQVIDLLTLWGDASDNVKGVAGVGEKTASKLIAQFGSTEAIYENLSSLKDKQRANFEAAKDHIALSKTLVTIKTDVPLDIKMEDMKVDGNYSPKAAELFDLYEFNSLKRYLGETKAPKNDEQRPPFSTKEIPLEELCRKALENGRVAVSTLSDGNGPLSPARKVFLAVKEEEGLYGVCSALPDEAASLLKDEKIEKCGYDLKLQSNNLERSSITLGGRFLDIELMHYLIDPEKSHKIENLSRQYLGLDIESISPGGKEEVEEMSLFDAPAEESEDEKESGIPERTAVLLPICEKVLLSLEKVGALSLYDRVEEPLSKVLAKMERDGVKIDMGVLSQYALGLRNEIGRREAAIREMAGNPSLNVSSPKQIGELLFDTLKLDPKAKKTGKSQQYQTDEATLAALSMKHPIIDEILEFRAAKKLLSTYIDPFPSYVSPITGRVHTTFNQALTSTGRLSSSNPNLQNIPIRTDRGREIRKAFIPGRPDGVVLSADYSQIELRVMAHLSCDAHLVKAFNEGEDIHAATASKIFSIPISDVTSEQRRIAKTANFGIMYGISAFGLAQRLKIKNGEAKKLIEDYFAAFPAIRSFIDDTLSLARENGYVETLFGRRRYLPDINARNATVRSLSERNAVNAPIQGTAADIIKMAMISVERRIRKEGLSSRMVLQIHDELLFDALEDEIDTLEKIVVEEMEGVIKLSIPLTVECNYGKNWLEAH